MVREEERRGRIRIGFVEEQCFKSGVKVFSCFKSM